jgi:hypothetical protein
MTSGELTYHQILDAVKRLPAPQQQQLLEEIAALPPESRVPETCDDMEAPTVPDTDRVYSPEQMARAFDAIGRPIVEDDATLSFDPDDYLLSTI